MASHEVTDSRGKTWRTSQRGYTHCVVVHMEAAESVATWKRSRALAQRNAASWAKFGHVEAIEIIPVSARRKTPHPVGV